MTGHTGNLAILPAVGFSKSLGYEWVRIGQQQDWYAVARRGLCTGLLHHSHDFQAEVFGFATLAVMPANQRNQGFGQSCQTNGQAAFGQMTGECALIRLGIVRCRQSCPDRKGKASQPRDCKILWRSSRESMARLSKCSRRW